MFKIKLKTTKFKIIKFEIHIEVLSINYLKDRVYYD